MGDCLTTRGADPLEDGLRSWVVWSLVGLVFVCFGTPFLGKIP
ncbi:hypothetical protein RRSWK_04775 [Rhodopirellula sp. SWK7]|nr:hypothetical protein RRSWK_04775 [Rhodopirellula sp. SWK7]